MRRNDNLMNKNIILTVVIIVLVAVFLKDKNKNELKINSAETIAKVIEVIDKRKGITTSEKIVLIQIDVNGYIIEEIVPYQSKMKVGKCYKAKYAKGNTSNIELDLSKEIFCK